MNHFYGHLKNFQLLPYGTLYWKGLLFRMDCPPDGKSRLAEPHGQDSGNGFENFCFGEFT